VSYGFLHRWTESARSSVVRPSRPFRRVVGRAEIEPGWLVADVNGQGVGKVRGREGDFIAVSRGLGRSPLYVPLTAIAEVRDGTIRLNLSASSMGDRRWSEKPRSAGRQ
jgi:hypothetical protein